MSKKAIHKDDEIVNMIHQNRLEEYRQLRAEIRHYLDRRNQNIKFAITLTLGVLAVGFQLDNFALFFATFFLTLVIWFDQVRTTKAVNRVATYQELFLEKELDGISWETLGAKHDFHNKSESTFERLFANSTYPTLAVINGSSATVILNKEFTVGLCFNILIVVALFISTLLLGIRSYLVSRRGRNRAMEEWKRALKE